MSMTMRTQIQITGIVQGVGFRPFVSSLAAKNALNGRVANNESGVVVDLEGDRLQIENFIDTLQTNPPPLSSIDSVTRRDIATAANFESFEIAASLQNGAKSVPVSPDVATCSDCLRELFDPSNRRYMYPFINCTNCGPRITIVESVPYDRARTTMREFEMCVACDAEYNDPTNRRFHAEPTCCPKCGPEISLHDGANPDSNSPNSIEVIDRAKGLLRDGRILAVKGVGGYHLVCDALNVDAVKELRKRKYREAKPFALMAESVEVIERYCIVSDAEKDLLASAASPIVLLERRPGLDASTIPDAIAPGVNTLGFMRPYTPLHHLLLEGLDGPLVMTSGNLSDEPIAYTDADASERLNKIADYYLTHDRRIHIRMDDSVMRWRRCQNSPMTLRRSRGFAPAPIRTSFKFTKQILGCGAELKNTFCLAKESYAFVSHHIGDLENLETLESFTTGIEHYKNLFDIAPEVIAYDLHPEYLSTKYAHACDDIATKIGVQHHHAHIASCMADNKVEGEVIGIAMDGLGYGTDDKLWGGEFFVADFRHAERIGHLDYVHLPGGAKAVREPWRMAATYLQKAFGDQFLDLDIPFVKGLDREKWRTLRSMIGTSTNSPDTSSVGRLFDAVSALLGVRDVAMYEGQAAIELEAVADRQTTGGYEFEIADDGIIKTETVIQAAVADLLDGRSAAEVSSRFHNAVASMIADFATQIREDRKLTRVALSGGVFQNVFLLDRTVRLLADRGFEVLTHSRVPCNDGGISLGQAAIANAQLPSRQF